MDEEKIDKLVAAVREQLQFDKDNLNAAVDVAVDFSKQNSIASESLLELSSLFGSNNAYASAYVFAKAASNLSEGKMKAGACCNAGLALSYMGRNEEAEEQYKQALVLDSNHVNAHYNYGLLLQQTGRNEEAEEQYKQALVLDPNDVNAHYNYGNFLWETGRNEEAEEQYKQALVLDPNDVNAHYNYGNLLQETGRNEEAEEQYKQALVLDSNHVNAHYNYGLLLQQTGRNEEAEEQYKTALVLDLNHVTTHSNYGLLLQETGRNEEAEEQYKQALVLDPNHVNAHYNYGHLLQETGRNEEAEEQYKQALVLDPNHVNAHFNYGLLLREMERNDEAEEQYKQALVLDPNDVNAHYNYGLLLREMERNEDAEEQYKTALVLGPNYANAHGAYGLLLFATGDEKKALEEIKTAARLFAENGDNVMEHLAMAWLYERYAQRYYEIGNALKEKKKKSGGYFRKSGVYAGLAGDEYIDAGKHAEDKGKGLYLSQGYTLKGRSEIRTLELSFQDKIGLRMRNLQRDDYEIAKYELIMDGVKDAASYYKKAAKHSPERNPQCDTCSNCMSALSDMLDYMLSIIHQRNVPDLNEKIKDWNELLASAEMGQQKSEKGEKFIEALRKFIPCIDNLEKYKNTTRHEYKKALKDCMSELEEVASNIEGPLQEIIEKSAQQMKKCMLKHKLYTSGTETEPKNDGVISKIANKVWDEIYKIIAIAIVTIIVFITSLF